MKALEKNSKYAPALFNLGFICQNNLNDHDQAVAYFKKYLNVASDGLNADYARQILKPKQDVKENAVEAVATSVVMSVATTPTGVPSAPL